jgi:hypothetical protein
VALSPDEFAHPPCYYHRSWGSKLHRVSATSSSITPTGFRVSRLSGSEFKNCVASTVVILLRVPFSLRKAVAEKEINTRHSISRNGWNGNGHRDLYTEGQTESEH